MICKRLIGEKVSLGPVTAGEVEKWYGWLNDLAVAIPLGSEAYTPVTLEGLQKEYKSIVDDESHAFSIIDNESGSSIGRCLLFDVCHINRAAKLEIFIGDKDYLGKGYGREAIGLLLEYAFNLLNLNSIVLLVYDYNQRAIKCYKNAGFREIGKRRQAKLIGGRFYDLLMMDMLASEFKGSIVSDNIRQLQD